MVLMIAGKLYVNDMLLLIISGVQESGLRRRLTHN
jgi:hypothetical protein